MKSDKEIKAEFKITASISPDTFYPTSFLKKEGFIRRQCTTCGTWFWTVNESQHHCGNPTCAGGFQVVSNNPAKVHLTYKQVWDKTVEILAPRGYKPIKRYPVVSRWNPTTDFVMASIAAFQPYVISGEQEPPAKKLIIPQFCLRFGDIDNVGITGSHNTGFVMIGQHAFLPREQWSQEQVFKDIYDFLTEGVGLPKTEITIHEDAWAGGGNFGPCLEFFSRGVELFNQVYMMFEQTPQGDRELKIKVLDMGMGMERIAWFTQGTANMYEAVFPNILNRLRAVTNIKMDLEMYKRFSAYSAYLNADEVSDMDEAWRFVAGKLGTDVETLRNTVLPMAGLYSIAEHARTLLVAISDGALPSNVGGGYNLRVILRRALSFIDTYSWKIDLAEVCAWHADDLADLFPELLGNIEDVKKIIGVEREKYIASREKAEKIVEKIATKNIDEQKLLELYDSNGISPDLIQKEAQKRGIAVKIPDDFYAKVSALHEKRAQVHATVRSDTLTLDGVPETKAMYYDDYEKTQFTARVLKIIDTKVILDSTCFYPTSGGQLHDVGAINDIPVVDVFKQGAVIVHVLDHNPEFTQGAEVSGSIDKERRLQLAQHHTSAHIINAAARMVLGNHINQAGAKKDLDKAHLDVTHYQSITDDELARIEQKSNEIVKEAHPVISEILPKTEAEQKYGMGIYQGGAIPGKTIRIINIPGIDAEACGGTHLKNTKEARIIKIIKTTKIQDGIVRIEFAAGAAGVQSCNSCQGIICEVGAMLGVSPDEVPARTTELFTKWKLAKKAVEKGKPIDLHDLELSDTGKCCGDALEETAKILSTQPEHVPKTIKRFLAELEEYKKRLANIKQ